MELDPEAHAHPHGTGHRKLDLALAFGAFAVSIASIAIALQNESAMKRLVLANSWPYLETNHGNVAQGRPVIHFDVRNAGIGPARLDKLVVLYDGKPVRDFKELLDRCCGGASELTVGVNLAIGRVFAARDEMSFLSLEKTAANASAWDRLDAERMKMDIVTCYSSVFEEHWITRMRNPKAVPVKDCGELPGPGYDADLYASE